MGNLLNFLCLLCVPMRPRRANTTILMTDNDRNRWWKHHDSFTYLIVYFQSMTVDQYRKYLQISIVTWTPTYFDLKKWYDPLDGMWSTSLIDIFNVRVAYALPPLALMFTFLTPFFIKWRILFFDLWSCWTAGVPFVLFLRNNKYLKNGKIT